MNENNPIKAAQPPEPRRGSTAEMVDRIREQISNPRVKIEPKEPPRGR
jgi:hypothetical protein